jgi:hypothetical protein
MLYIRVLELFLCHMHLHGRRHTHLKFYNLQDEHIGIGNLYVSVGVLSFFIFLVSVAAIITLKFP